MTEFTATSVAQLRSHLAASVGGDVILVAPGVYAAATPLTAIINGNNTTKAGSGVVIKSADPNNRAVLRNTVLTTSTAIGLRGVEFQDLDFTGTTVEYSDGGVSYPGTPGGGRNPAISTRGDNALVFRRVRIQFYRSGAWHSGSGSSGPSQIEYRNCEFTKIQEDSIFSQCGIALLRIVENAFYDELIHPTRYTESDRHPDNIQLVLNNVTGPYLDTQILNNLFRCRLAKPIFLDDGARTLAELGFNFRHVNPIIEGNDIVASRTITLGLQDATGGFIRYNKIVRNPAGPQNPYINREGNQHNLTITDNVMAVALRNVDPRVETGFQNITRNSTNPADTPPNFAPRVLGVNVGVYDSGGTKPPQQTDPNAHGQFPADVWEQTEQLGRFKRPYIVKTTSPAFGAGAEPDNHRWRRNASSPWRGFEWAPQPTNSAGSRRFWPVGPDSDVDLSTYSTDSGLSPNAPPPDALAALTSGQWGAHAVVAVGGRFTWQLWADPTAGPPALVYWTLDNGATRRPTYDTGLTNAGRKVWQLMPSSGGGVDHLVGYDESLSGIKLVYGLGEQVSAVSIDAKGFTGPATPVVEIPPYTPFLRSGVRVKMAGRRVVRAHPNRPDAVPGDIFTDGVSEFTLDLPHQLPPGADFIQVIYPGLALPLRPGGGTLVISKVVGADRVLVRGVSRTYGGGIPRLFRIASSPHLGLVDDGHGGHNWSTAPTYGLADDGHGGHNWSATPTYLVNSASYAWEAI